MESQAAERFLVQEVSIPALTDEELQDFARHLSFLNQNQGAIDLLDEVARLGGAAGKLATELLEDKGIMSNERLQELAREWREHRSPEALSKLYYGYISTARARMAPLSKIIELLGTPSGSDSGAVWYVSTPGTALYLEKDSAGRFSAFRMS
jgi:hypothetical protein